MRDGTVGDHLAHPALIAVPGITDIGREGERKHAVLVQPDEHCIDILPVRFVRCGEISGLGQRVNVLERSIPRRTIEPPEERCGTGIVERDVPAARIVADQEQLQTVEAARE